MDIYYFMIQAEPLDCNTEKAQHLGAYVNCWVKAENSDSAIEQACGYINNEEWKPLKVEEHFIPERAEYLEQGLEASLKCYDQAVEEGISGIFYCYTEEDC
ncbi:MAG: hypothetical protein DKM50_02145 [Candidatus Margulisiibacteriota bacterium]|nr:MAG: hypothetical protein A2X43_06605 [Candidatus Margulisbacteria bacterium GWD2_39_127]OGI05310.1 MAG: hypothetical protein A2X42_03880 [Candidatus Margulisbacteria bacterium GWF2_38_17]OGI10831.1 MAG: hypothetical protein A2X41_05595 [Candidatus Margulisbacteria bacterium GWE2_39_32]PZM83517.1 MAG: hypothetical protein DKM50_02145 [Candidatus Margulisiibacteriota bacterium]HAR64306.1 hypothetical protein [Candidatus Margulisiibacteriota bacterium]